VIARLLMCLSKQTCHNFETIIVDSSDRKSSLKDLRRMAQSLNLKIIYNKCGRGTARNIGVRHSKAEVLVFVDADVILPSNFAEEVVRLFAENSEMVAVGFPIYPTKLNTITELIYGCLNAMNRFSYRYGRPRIQTTCAAYRCRIFQYRFFLDLVGEDILFSADATKYGKDCYAEHIKILEEPRRWEKGEDIMKSLWHYFPSYIIYLLSVAGFHNLLMPKFNYDLVSSQVKVG